MVGDRQQRIFRIQISKFEYCKGKVERVFDDYSIYVYTPAMIVIEKLRAICQQMTEYLSRACATARARDFYDICSTVKAANIDLASSENLELVRNVFAAKSVPMVLLPLIKNYREFHRPDWPSVELTISEKPEAFDYYFDFVVDQVQLLKPLWEV